MAERVGVVGGGALGLTAAVELAERGAVVTLFERGELGSGATGRAAGLCYDAYAGKRDARIASASLDRFRELDLVTECPYLWFARDDETAAALESQAERMRELGRDVSVLDPPAVAERFPPMATDDMVTAAVAENAGYLDTPRYVDAMAKKAREAGVRFRTGSPASVTRDGSVRTPETTDDFDSVLVAAGAHTEGILSDAGVDLAVGLYRTQALTAGPVDGGIPMFYDATGEYYGRPTGDGVLAGDGSHTYRGEPGEYDTAADDSFVADRLATLGERVDAGLSVRESWAGLCTATPDRNPLLGECAPDLYVATGFCGHGFMRSPALGKRIATRMLGGDGIDAFDPTRFAGDEAIDLPLGITD
jgi:sarcosine oxidase subunit beta